MQISNQVYEKDFNKQVSLKLDSDQSLVTSCPKQNTVINVS